MNQTLYARALALLDRLRWHFWLRYSNGASQLQLAYQCVDDTADSLEAVHAALRDGDTDEALKLLALAHDSLIDHANTLKGLL